MFAHFLLPVRLNELLHHPDQDMLIRAKLSSLEFDRVTVAVQAYWRSWERRSVVGRNIPSFVSFQPFEPSAEIKSLVQRPPQLVSFMLARTA